VSFDLVVLQKVKCPPTPRRSTHTHQTHPLVQLAPKSKRQNAPRCGLIEAAAPRTLASPPPPAAVMDDDRDHDQDPDASSPAAPWRRSVKRKLGAEAGDEAGPAARVEAEDERAALREAAAAAQSTASALRVEVEEERLAAASAASEAMAMMLRLQRDKAEVQMELRQFRRFADEKMALDAAEIDQLRALLAQRARRLLRLRSRLREYRLQCLHLGIPLPEGEDLVAQNAAEEEEEDLLLLEGEEGYIVGDGGYYYPELRCNDGEYYYEDGREEEDVVALDLERRICLLEHDQEPRLLEPPHEKEEGTHLYTDEVLPDMSEHELGGLYADEMLSKEDVETMNNLHNDDEELPESPTAGNDDGEEASEADGADSVSGSGSDRVYTIDKVHQGAAMPIARVVDKYQGEAVEPDIKKLYMRLEALEADRESMRQALVAMRTEKAQLVLLREIAQQLAKDGVPVGPGAGAGPGVHHLPRKHAVGIVERRFTEDKKAILVKTFSMAALFKVCCLFY
jgi:hypothetical protein